MNKQLKAYIGVGAVVMSLVTLMPFSALAGNGSDKERGRDSVTIRPHIEVSQSVDVNQNGKVTLRGTVLSVGTGTMAVKSWGGEWAVAIGSDTKINSRANGVVLFGDIKIGDFVMVHGDMKVGSGLSIQARQVKDHFIPDRSVAVRGTIASLGANTLTVKSGEATWTVNTTASTKFSSKFEVATTLATMKVGDTVAVKGVLATGSTTTVNATEVKNTSLPPNAVGTLEKKDNKGRR